MNVLVTGGTGLVGSHVITELLDHGHTAANYDVRPPDQKACEFFQGDLLDTTALARAMAGRDAVAHLAAVPAPRDPPEWPTMIQVNVVGTFNILHTAVAQRVKKVVYASSACVAGVCNAKLHPPPAYLPFDDDSQAEIDDLYSLTKVINERCARLYHARFGLITIGLRLWNVWPAHRDGARVLHSGVDFAKVDARDVASAFRLALENETVQCDTMHIGPKLRYTQEGKPEPPEVTMRLIKERGVRQVRVHDRFPFASGSNVSSQKAIDLLGYEPRF